MPARRALPRLRRGSLTGGFSSLARAQHLLNLGQRHSTGEHRDTFFRLDPALVAIQPDT